MKAIKILRNTAPMKMSAIIALISLHSASMAFVPMDPKEGNKLDDGITTCRTSAAVSSAIEPIQSGLWSSASTWPNGDKPSASDDIIIPAGVTLTLIGSCKAKSITVHGTLNALSSQEADAGIALATESILVAGGGKLEIGSESNPYHASDRCVITLKGAKINNAPAAYKGIMVLDGGTLELHGKQRKSWTNIATTAEAGDSQITLKEPVDWEVGDIIALTSTALAIHKSNAWERVDQVEISAISADQKTLTLAQPLQYKHIGGSKSYTRHTDGKTWDVDIFGEVGLLSHYIKIQGDETSDMQGFGGHIMVMRGSTSHVEHVELYKMGQKGILARYPFHWHLNEDKAKGSYLKNSSIHKSYNRAVTIHGTDYVTVDGVFAYDHIGHGIFLEDGGERFNTIKNNVVFVTRRPKQGEQTTPSDNFSDEPSLGDTPQNRTPASYWITNPNNYFENNVAAGTEGTGFWFAFPKSPMFATGQLPYFQGLNPTTQPLGSFDGFVAHTCMNGWDVFDQLNADHSIKRNFGWNIGTRQLIKNGLFYGNDQALYCGLGNSDNENVVFYDCVFSDNKTITMLAGDLTIENSLFNADTELGLFEGVREFFRFYDGPGRHIDCHFEGWNRSNAEMIKQIAGGGATENFNPSFRGTTKGFSEPFPFRFKPLPHTEDTRTRKIGQFFKDYDGGLTGKANTTLIRDIPFLIDGHEYRHESWENAARSDYFFAGLWLAGINASGVRMSIVRSKPSTEDVCFYESGTPASGTYKFPLIVNEGFMYSYYMDQAPANKSILLIWNRGEPGDLALTCFKGLGKLGNFRVTGHQFELPLLNSKSAVEDATDNAYFIDPSNGDVYLKLRNLGGSNRLNIFFNWDHNGTFQPDPLPCTSNDLNGINVLTDSDGDGRPDIHEPETCGLINSASDLRFDFKHSNEGFEKVNFTESNEDNEAYWEVIVDKSNDPYITRDGLNFKGSQAPQIVIRAKSEADGPFQFFWGTSKANSFSPDRVVTVHPKETNVFEELVFDMSDDNAWMDQTITKIRLDLPGDASNIRYAYIDYIHGPNAETPFCESLELSFEKPSGDVLVEGDDLDVEVAVTEGSVFNIELYLNDLLVRKDDTAPFQWGFANSDQEIDSVLLGLDTGTYVLKAIATSANGTISKTKTITVEELILSEELLLNDKVTIYPNPAEEFVHLSFNDSWETANVEIYNTAGSRVLYDIVNNGGTLNISDLRSGLYLLYISYDKVFIKRKLQVR
ncbi:G8 domain-containing protein [Marinoscillum furvescens]|uniref:Putative secreted protein (Por secretion system target) n=1 Tax=Marinoscillum furvescens DSM 4134 TaxID=1122208 RepID=A0A3D9L428_MARFU|nr:G8 domain-containing protein [Marinoscillum furvescens]RED98331.1 putative secreted protein (Por secretion system target) [Marinoscillum furvescens DSM 4134]